MTVSGVVNVLANMQGAFAIRRAQGKKNLWITGLFILAQAKIRTPIATGNLRNDSVVEPVFGLPNGQQAVDIIFNANYAVWVHEIPYRHVGAPFVDWKFLQRAIDDNLETIKKKLTVGLGV